MVPVNTLTGTIDDKAVSDTRNPTVTKTNQLSTLGYIFLLLLMYLVLLLACDDPLPQVQ